MRYLATFLSSSCLAFAPFAPWALAGNQSLGLVFGLNIAKASEKPHSDEHGFQGVFISMKLEILTATAYANLQKIVTQKLGANWMVRPYSSYRFDFLAFPKNRLDISPAQAEMLAQKLRGLKKISTARAIFDTPVEQGTQDYVECRNSMACSTSPFSTRDPDWSLKMGRVFEAWQAPKDANGKEPGEGVEIGIPDTGYLEHPEYWPASGEPPSFLQLHKSANFLEGTKGNDSAKDPYSMRSIFPNPGHGSNIIGILVAARGPKTLYENRLSNPTWTTGIAPAAKIIPVRVASSTFLTNGEGMARAIYHLVDQGAKVVSISMGGFPYPAVRKAVSYATEQGVIVVAAAGNGVKFVPWPAAYSDVIAVGAGTIECEAWPESATGSKVEILAPGADVWHASTFKSKEGLFYYVVRRAHGTSFSAPFVAGVAALWLSRHGWTELVATYGKRNVSAVFRSVLASGGTQPCPGLDTQKHGRGFIDALGMVTAPLPLPEKLPRIFALDQSEFE